MGVTVFTLLINDFKIVHHESAEIQTHALAASKFEYEGSLCSVILGLQMTIDKISLFVYLACEQTLSAIKVLFHDLYKRSTATVVVCCLCSYHQFSYKTYHNCQLAAFYTQLRGYHCACVTTLTARPRYVINLG